MNILQLTYDKNEIYYIVSKALVIPAMKVLSMSRPISQLPAPSRTDLEILAVLWDQPGATGRAIYDALLDTGRLRRRIAYTTIKTYPNVSQFWTYDEKWFLSQPVYSRDYPPLKT